MSQIPSASDRFGRKNSASIKTPARRASSKEIELDTEEDKQDPAEVLAEYFHETMSNLAWLASAAKI